MKLKMAVATVMLGGLMLSAPVSAAPQGKSGFSALHGVDAQALSVEEMKAISGELNAFDIAANLVVVAAGLEGFPEWQASILRWADFYTTNADQINAVFKQFGVFTGCKSCTP